MKQITIRPSSVHGAFECYYKWAQVHLLGVRSFSGFSALRGTGVHGGAEHIWTESQKAGQKTFNLSAAKDAAAQAVEDKYSNEEVRFEGFESVDGAKDDAVAGVDVYAKEIVPNVEIPLYVEKYYEAEVDDNIFIKGTSDAIQNDGTIRDIKTSTRKKTGSEYVEQLSIYARLTEVNEGLPIQPKAIIENIVFGKNDIKAHLLDVNIDVVGTKRKIDDIIKRVKWFNENKIADMEMIFPANPNSFFCDERYCLVYNECYIRNERIPF